MFANIPAMLGFYPQESFVLGFFAPNEQRGYTLGPIARVSIADEQYYDAVFAGISDRPQGMIVFVYAITGELENPQVIQALQALMGAANRFAVSIEAAWCAKIIQTGEPYRLLCGPRADELTTATTGVDCWEAGHIAPPYASIAFRHLAASGELPELDRDAAYAFFGADASEQHRQWVNRITKQGVRRAADMLAEITADNAHGRRTFTIAMSSFTALLRRIERQGRGVDKLMHDEECMEYAAAYWSNNLFRDATLAAASGEHAAAMGTLALAAARNFRGQLRANALCVFAVTTLAGDVWVRALPAVRVALDEVPEHRFAELLHEAILTGFGRLALNSCVRAAKHLAWQYGEKIPDAA